MIRVFIGHDPRETVALNVLQNSIQRMASRSVAVSWLKLEQLAHVFSRPRDLMQSTDFAFSRFLVPYLCDFQGWAIFLDCDMLFREDIVRLWDLRDDRFSVMCVKHEHIPREESKFLGAVQTKYEKKNWSSVMLFNCDKCKSLTPEYVNTASGLQLHQFKWLSNDSLIGALPSKWNHLVGYDAPRADAANVHYTIGGPYFNEYRQCEYGEEWFRERDELLKVSQRF